MFATLLWTDRINLWRCCRSRVLYRLGDDCRSGKKYRSISGFAHYPNGFCVVEHAVIGETDCDYEAVYLAEVYIHDNQYEFERDFCLGVFANRASAEKRMSVFQKNNVQFIGKSGLCVECMVSRYELNKMEWREGFITETT